MSNKIKYFPHNEFDLKGSEMLEYNPRTQTFTVMEDCIVTITGTFRIGDQIGINTAPITIPHKKESFLEILYKLLT